MGKTELTPHPAAEIFPLMHGAEFAALVADIKEHGLRENIIIHEGKILDGRNRYRACVQLGIAPNFVEWLRQGGTAEQFVVSMNLHRRHLNESQRAMIAAKLANIKPGEVGGGREKAEMQISTSDAAALLNVSRHTVAYAKTVQREGSPEQIKAVESGRAAVSTTSREIRGKPTDGGKVYKPKPVRKGGVGKNPERIQRQQMNAEVWGRFRDALTNLTSLPLPADVAEIVRLNDKAGLTDARLSRATTWLKEFSDVWNRRDEAAA